MLKNALAAREARLKDPTLQAKLDIERQKSMDALGDAGKQTLNSLTRIIWNSTGGMFVPQKVKDGKKTKLEMNPTGQMHEGAVDSTVALGQAVGSILKAAGRTAWWGIRRGIAK